MDALILDKLSIKLSVPLSLENGELIADFNFYCLAAAISYGQALKKYWIKIGLPVVALNLRYYDGAMTVPFKYLLNPVIKTNSIRPHHVCGLGVMGKAKRMF